MDEFTMNLEPKETQQYGLLTSAAKKCKKLN